VRGAIQASNRYGRQLRGERVVTDHINHIASTVIPAHARRHAEVSIVMSFSIAFSVTVEPLGWQPLQRDEPVVRVAA
jgi:hypothetical protein